MITKESLPKLLGRSLTPTELANFELYKSIAIGRIEQLLCMSFCEDDSDRTYDGRIGYKTQFVDPFTELTSVAVDGELIADTDYTIKKWDKRNAGWYNSIVFNKTICGDVTVNADWGFDSCPVDLALLIAKLFALNSTEQARNNVKSKKIEDFTVTCKDSETYDEVLNENSAVIRKYSLCNLGTIRHGEVREYYESIRSVY